MNKFKKKEIRTRGKSKMNKKSGIKTSFVPTIIISIIIVMIIVGVVRYDNNRPVKDCFFGCMASEQWNGTGFELIDTSNETYFNQTILPMLQRCDFICEVQD